jgi:oligopeptide transport system permease protein
MAGLIVLAAELLLCFGGLLYSRALIPPPESKADPSDPAARTVERFIAQDVSRGVNRDDGLHARPQLPAGAGGFSTDHPLGLNADGKETHLLGSDTLGRDVLARLLYGGCVSLSIGIASALAATLLGTLYGAISGYVGGWVDNLMMRVVEVLYSLPYMLLVILTFFVLKETPAGLSAKMSDDRSKAAVAALEARGIASPTPEQVSAATAEPGWLERAVSHPLLTKPGFRELLAMFVAVAAFNWMTQARVARGQILALKAMPYVEAARALGAGHGRVLLRHMMPNLLGPVIVFATLAVPQAILLESFLSFLGVGIQEPQVTWGLMAAEGIRTINLVQNHYWLIIPPCAALAVTLLALNFVGDGLRDAFDPQARR